MKKLIILALCCITCLASCTTETTYGTPDRTRYARVMFDNVEEAIANNISTMDLCIRLNDWCLAKTQEEKDQIDIDHFNFYKLRQSGDTINVINTQSSIDISAYMITHSCDITQPSSEWTLVYGGYKMVINCTAPDTWSLSITEPTLLNLELDATIKMLQKDKNKIYYSLEGSGKVEGAKEPTLDADIIYSIEEPLRLSRTNDLYFYSHSVAITNGTIVFTDCKEIDEKQAKIRFRNSGNYDISYRGFYRSEYRY